MFIDFKGGGLKGITAGGTQETINNNRMNLITIGKNTTKNGIVVSEEKEGGKNRRFFR
ncbi:MAG: hypothetical protein V3S48_07045 [Candidatus Neomarinimicrobiota bacterium]